MPNPTIFSSNFSLPSHPTIGIIGGNGIMGKFTQKILEDAKCRVIISDMNTELNNMDVAKRADIVIISVPIDVTKSVIQEIVPVLSDRQLLMDFTSLKRPFLDTFLSSKADVICLHPMFNPSVGILNQQTVIYIPVRDRLGWGKMVTQFLFDRGAKIKESTPEYHDKMMSLIQVLIHYNTISIGITMAKLGFDIDDTLEFTSPIYRMELAMIGRIFAQNPRLYGNIPMFNEFTPQVILEHKMTLEEMSKLIITKDLKGFEEKFQLGAEFFKDFKDWAMKESNYLIDKMVAHENTLQKK